jgi:hypothetical protein
LSALEALSILICLQHAKELFMNAITHPYQLRLARRGLYEIPDVSGVDVACHEGSVWITLDDDPRDIILERGGSFRGTQRRRALIYAFEASELVVAPSVGKSSPVPAPVFHGGLAHAG